MTLMRWINRFLVFVLVLSASGLSASAAHSGIAQAQSAAQGEAPQSIASTQAADAATVFFMSDVLGAGQIAIGDAWLIGGGYLYWAQCATIGPPALASKNQQPQNAAATTGYLRRWPIRGGAVATLSNNPFCATASWAADDSGLYYYEGKFIYRRSLANAATPVAVVDTGVYDVAGALVVDGSSLFYILGNNWIYRTPKAQTNVPDDPRYDETLPVVDGGAGANGLIVNGNTLNFFGGGRVRRVSKGCTDPCALADLAIEQGVYLSNASISSPLAEPINPLWVSGPLELRGSQYYPGNQIRGYTCTFNSTGRVCNAGNVYTAPNRNDAVGTSSVAAIGPMASDGTYLFWVENLRSCVNGPFGLSCQPSYLGRLMKYHIKSKLTGPADPFDTPQPIATENSSGVFSIIGTPPVSVSDGWVYFDTSKGLSRIRADAPPISWDLSFKDWEITQGIQNLANDVPLVANKPTFVRAYGTKLNGPSAYGVEAILIGTAANGAPLGSLRALNGAQNFIADNTTPNRILTNGGWLFELPEAWTNAGISKLSLQIDPRAAFNDPNRGNNNTPAQSFNFTHKAPVCIVTIPVRTHAPAASNSDPSLIRMADVTRQILPTSDVWMFHQDTDVAQIEARFGLPPWKYEPYAVPEKKDNILRAIGLRNSFSDDPDQCDDIGAITHYVGLVHADTNTKGNLGYGSTPGDDLYVKLIDPTTLNSTPLFWTVQEFGTLAHELSHNYGRQHVNCGGPANPDPNYPYKDANGTNCVLDDGLRGGNPIPAYQRYYGFDTQNLVPIDPGTTADYMAYGPFWVSDYTWRALFNTIHNTALSMASAQKATAQSELAAATNVVYISGAIDPVANTGSLDYGWVLPSAAISQKVRAKLQLSAAPAAQTAGPYTLRLRDAAGALIDERAIVLQSTSDADGTVQNFAMTFAAPTVTVNRIELVSNGGVLSGTVLASLQPGSSAPTVNMLSPAGGETIDNAMTISFRASDPDLNDKLLFTVQYSPDNGQHWHTLLSGFPNRSGTDTTTINLNQLSGISASTTGGLIRVAASDGYNTTLAVSQPFTVVNRAPEPHIDAPTNAQQPAGQTLVLHGGATDVEDGGLSGAALRWSLDGVDIGTGQAQTIEGLAPGRYTLTLTARDAQGKEATAAQTLTVAALVIARAVPVFDGECNDDAYTNAVRVPLSPYADGTQASVTFARTDEALFACFSGMKRSAAGSPGTVAVVRVDTDDGRRTAPGANDHVFYTNEAGVMSTLMGNGTAFVAGNGGAGAQISANSTTWNAELRIEASSIGGMNHVVGLSVDQALLNADNVHYNWPHRADLLSPNTWATASLGDVPRTSAIAPSSALVGSGNLVMTINGSSFVTGTLAQLNGVAMATMVMSSTQLQATIPAANLTQASTFGVTVVNPGLEAVPSQAMSFDVTNPLPHITQAKLEGNVMTLMGSSFVPSATVQFAGIDYATTGDGAQVRITVSMADLIGNETASVTAFNPGPGGGVSNIVVLGAGPTAGTLPLYLPLITH